MLAELAALNGLEPHYYDMAGNLHVTAAETQAALLAAMGCRCQTLADLHQELERCRSWPWSEMLEPVLALSQAQLPAAWNLFLPLPAGRLPAALEVTCELKDETGTCLHREIFGPTLQLEEIRSFGKNTYGLVKLLLPPALPLGYFDLQVRVNSAGLQKQGQMLVIIAPDRMYIPESLNNERIWGINLPLYAIRSSHNWGIGDCGDLQRLLPLESQLNADIIGLNPLHYLGVLLQNNISPYYPTSRCYFSPLFLDLEMVPEMAASAAAQGYLGRTDIQQKITGLREQKHVDYPEVARLKATVLALLWETFISNHGLPGSPKTARGCDFAAFLDEHGKSLRQFATFLALAEFWQAQGRNYHSWQEWPADYHDPAGPAVAKFARGHDRQLLFHMYVQWLFSRQIQETQAEARERNLSLGLYLDLAVGVDPGGFDSWANQGLFAATVDIGAPPDTFSPLGQNWGLAPLLPQRLRDQKYRYFIQMLRQNSPMGGALRMDHVMGLFRLFWIPQGASPAQGAYVRYPAEDMLKILALESVKQQTVIIGEDLGTVSPNIREELAKKRVLSTRLFYFERQEDGAFTQASQYPEWAMASITTHDLPTLAGFWQGRDIEIRQNLKLFPDDQTAAYNWEDRRQSKAAILKLLGEKNLIDGSAASSLAAHTELPEQVKWGVIAHLAQTPSRLVLLSLEDIFGWLEQQNLPGTIDEYPNWRLRFPMSLEEILQARELGQAAEIMGRYRRGKS
jgi:4-alpha-glucanotransferase